MKADRSDDACEWLVPFLLLCMRGRDLRGHELMGQLADLGFGVVRPGEIYRTLRFAEAEGLVFSEREDLGYLLFRRRYGSAEVRADGVREGYIEFLADSLRSYREEIEVFLHAYTDLSLHGAYG